MNRDGGLLRTVALTTALCCMLGLAARAQEGRFFAGGVAGISTLSADAQSAVGAVGVDVSLYKPENGPALNLFAGLHLHDFVTLQANYIWNRNGLTLVSALDRVDGPRVFEVPFDSTQHAVVGDLLVFFRNRRSPVRPYLSAGLGTVRFSSRGREGGRVVGSTPPRDVRTTQALLRVAVGLDLALGRGWLFRYSFSESISGNPISEQLSPAGTRGLANFQNLFGIVRGL